MRGDAARNMSRYARKQTPGEPDDKSNAGRQQPHADDEVDRAHAANAEAGMRLLMGRGEREETQEPGRHALRVREEQTHEPGRGETAGMMKSPLCCWTPSGSSLPRPLRPAAWPKNVKTEQESRTSPIPIVAGDGEKLRADPRFVMGCEREEGSDAGRRPDCHLQQARRAKPQQLAEHQLLGPHGGEQTPPMMRFLLLFTETLQTDIRRR